MCCGREAAEQELHGFVLRVTEIELQKCLQKSARTLS